MDINSNKKWSLLICLALTLATLAVFYQVHSFKFLTIDDSAYVSKNPNVQGGITLKSIKWAFTTRNASNWHPLTWLSHMLDWQLFGSNPAGHHMVSVIFHIANTLILLLVLKRMTGVLWPSAFTAGLFAIHPLHVESVAWIAERKDVLSVFFWLLAMGAYLRYAKRPNVTAYLLTLSAFALGLMAKPMAVTLPFVLLLLDYWPLGRIDSFNRQIIYRLVFEKIPFFILSAASSVITFFAQQSGEAVVPFARFPLKLRVFNAIVSYAEYIEKMLLPRHLAFFYPHPEQNISILYVIISAVFLGVVTILVFRAAPNHRYLVTGWLWYIGTLVPVIGFVQVGGQAMADRYTYISLTGLFIIIAWGLPELPGKSPHRKIALWALSLTCLASLTVCTYFQTRYWKDAMTLCEHAIKVTNDNYQAHCCMAKLLLEQGKIEEAIGHSTEAVRISPRYDYALNLLGLCYYKAGRIDDAVSCSRKVLEIRPQDKASHLNLAAVLLAKGNFAEAVTHYRIGEAAIEASGMHNDFGYALLKTGLFKESAAEYRKALSATSNDPNILNNFGYALEHSGESDEAIAMYKKALQINPKYALARNNLDRILAEKQKSGSTENTKK